MSRVLLTSISLFFVASFFFSASAKASCSETADPIGTCVVSNGDTFTFAENADCGYDEYKRHGDPDPNRAISAGADADPQQTTYVFERNLVVLPERVRFKINEVLVTTQIEATALYYSIRNEAKRKAAVKRLYNRARTRIVYGGEVFEIDPVKQAKLVGSLRCRIIGE